ncbi:MAG: DUF3375 domain-containing protein [Phaeodactylibacter sp.]|uniref:DUF3375 domain-containing protein n=1 Tax=Phaeodactylibacter sp. TaxID=1940289 RepID=UPI0032ECE1EC
MADRFSNIEEVGRLLEEHRAVRLLRKTHAPMIAAFLWRAFREERRQAYGSQELNTMLSDFLFAANEGAEEGGKPYPRTARAYLEEWTQEGFLRQYYEVGAPEATFELTPATEQALVWMAELDKREFVGAESRLLQLFNMLQDLTYGSSTDAQARLDQLLAQRLELDRQIMELEEGEVSRLDPTRMREQLGLIEETAAKLLADFRQIEENFRQLNTKAREEQINRQHSRGQVLDEIFSAQDAIMETDQGKTFTAFWAFLMDQERQDRLDQMAEQLFEQPELEAYRAYSVLPRLKILLVEAGERVDRTTTRLIEQLRRFLASRTFLENRRAGQVIEEIEQLALQVKSHPPPQRFFSDIAGKPAVNLVMERRLFQPADELQLATDQPVPGNAIKVLAEGLYNQLYIDPEELKGRIQKMLRGKKQVSLKEIVAHTPVEKGLSEVVAYFSLATQWELRQKAVVNTKQQEKLFYESEGRTYAVELPQILFLK